MIISTISILNKSRLSEVIQATDWNAGKRGSSIARNEVVLFLVVGFA
jgi:hypothetical protein